MKNKLIFNLLGLILFISPSFSQNRILNLDDAINIALENNRDIKLSKMTVEKAGAAVDEAFGYALPSLDLNGTFTHFLRKPKMPFPDFGALFKKTQPTQYYLTKMLFREITTNSFRLKHNFSHLRNQITMKHNCFLLKLCSAQLCFVELVLQEFIIIYQKRN